MNRPDPTELRLRRFLAADRAGRAAEAEALLAELFRELPVLGPRPGFAARVAARLGIRRERPWLARPAVRLGLAAALVAAALAVALVPAALAPLAGLVGPAGSVGWFARGLAQLAVRFAGGLAAWEPLVAVARALGLALLEPEMAALLALQFLIAALALRGLAALAAVERSPVHAAF